MGAPGANNDNEMALLATAVGVHQLLSQVAATSKITQATPTAASETPNVVEPVPTAVSPSQLFIDPSANATTTDSVPKVQYRVRNPADEVSRAPSRQGSIDGAPEIGLNIHTNAETRQDAMEIDMPELAVDLRDYIGTIDDAESHVSSSQKSTDGCQDLLPPPSDSQPLRSDSVGVEVTNQLQPATVRAYPQLDVDEGDLPAWMVDKGRWKYITSIAGGPTWEELLKVYLRQERRLEFSDMVGNSLALSNL
jgi:hypothetical protein